MTGETAEPRSTPADLFGTSSEGGLRLLEWLGAMCAGCRHERAKDRAAGIGGGSGCDLVYRAIGDPYTAQMPEWVADDAPRPERLAGLGDGPWPVCVAWEPRKKRADAGVRRGPRVKGMRPLFDLREVQAR